jgi:DNA helicase-2/ATP-dependent DNA helicase PcrA
MTSSAGSKPEDALDQEQEAAVTASEKAIAVLAGPGSGKTRALSYRARRLLLADPRANALLLTFTNKAAAEMKARALGVSGLPGRRIHASTFHTFCADVLRAHGELVGVSREFEILDQGESDELAQAVARERRLPDASKPWRDARLKREPVTNAVFQAFGAAYEAEKRRHGVVDFDDLVVHVADILEKHPEIARAFGTKYPHMLVDEFQDTNAVQFAIVDALSTHAASVSIFADDDQAIFGFAGADSENIHRFAAKLGAREFPLTMNYRSRAEIVKLANALIDADPGSSGRHMRAHASGGVVRYEVYPTAEEEARQTAVDVAGHIARGTPTADIAILVRSGYRADAVGRELQARGLPVSDWRGVTHQPKDRRVLATCLAVVRGTLSGRQVQRLCELMGVPPSAETRTEAFLAAHSANPLASGLVEVRRLAFGGAPPHEISRAAQRAVASLRPELEASLGGIVEAVSHFELYDREFTLEHLLAELALGSVGRPPTEGGGVKIASLHRTKGLQWKRVYLIGLEDGHIPDFRMTSNVAEERRLCFVGVSRAQEALTLSRARVVGRHTREPSPFLAEMGFR